MKTLLNNQSRKNELETNSQIILPTNKDGKIPKTSKHAQKLQKISPWCLEITIAWKTTDWKYFFSTNL